jgi:alkanesulfonate monooxygenase SsuD/methylene tetrahydromethanopterin reductase-like flavin-dependent oxidoreductase (luciferase family)
MNNAEKGVVPASQNARRLMSLGVDEAMAQGILFCGTPDSVYRQIMDFYDKVGGFGHLTMIGRSGFMTHAEATKGIKLFSREVMPRLRAIKPIVAE